MATFIDEHFRENELSDNTIFVINVGRELNKLNSMTFEEQYIIKLCGDVTDFANNLPAIHGHELADINFHLRAIQNIIYARQTISNDSTIHKS